MGHDAAVEFAGQGVEGGGRVCGAGGRHGEEIWVGVDGWGPGGRHGEWMRVGVEDEWMVEVENLWAWWRGLMLSQRLCVGEVTGGDGAGVGG